MWVPEESLETNANSMPNWMRGFYDDFHQERPQ